MMNRSDTMIDTKDRKLATGEQIKEYKKLINEHNMQHHVSELEHIHRFTYFEMAAHLVQLRAEIHQQNYPK